MAQATVPVSSRRGHAAVQDEPRSETEVIQAPIGDCVAAPSSQDDSDGESESDEPNSVAESIIEQTHGETCGGSEVSEPTSPAGEEFFLPEAEVTESEEGCVPTFQGFNGETSSSVAVAPDNNYFSPASDFAHPILPAGAQDEEVPTIVDESADEFNPEMDVDSILRPEGPLVECCRRGADVSEEGALDSSKFYCLKFRRNAGGEDDCDVQSVCDVSSPDASCQSSPEGALSLCGEFGGSPLDIGAPALDHAAAALMVGDSCDGILIAGLDATMCW